MRQKALWSIGFRPFFLFGSILSVLLVLYWSTSFFLGHLPEGFFDPIYWHAHEMIFGFVLAIVAGFLLTAGASWTKTPPVTGKTLVIVFSLWLLGRSAFFLSLFSLPIATWIYAIADLLFLPSLIVCLAPPLIRAKQLKNIQFVFILGLMTFANLLFHLAALGLIDFLWTGRSIYLAVYMILVIIVVVGGRVIPFFAENAAPLAKPRRYRALEWGSVISVWAFILVDFSYVDSPVVGYVALFAGVLNLSRVLCWRPWMILRQPLLWILYCGYLWIPIGFFLIAVAELDGSINRSSALHSFTTGAMGTFIICMMSRVSLGHTGRPLKLSEYFVWAYVMILLAGVVRVGSGFFPDYYQHGILCSGLLWAISYTLYILYYSQILVTPRPDGKM